MSSAEPIKVAIIGGGLAGATLANAILKHDHLDVNIFESASEFSERGAAVSLAANAQAALAEIGGEVADVVERAGGVVMSSSRLCMGSGPDAMSIVFDLGAEMRGKVVHRAALLAELLKPIEDKKKHTNRKVISINDSAKGQVEINFEDGTVFHADAVVGADGVRGYVRCHVLGKDHPAVPAKVAGFWDARSLIPMQKAKALLGEEYFEIDRQYGWIGEGGFIMHDVLDGGDTVQCVVCGIVGEGDEWAEGEWSKPLDRAALEKALEEWTDTPLKKGIVEAMLQNPDLKAFAETHHAIDAPTYANGRTCIIGDAAHSMTPWQGSGAGQAIEDAMILQTLLEKIKSPDQVAMAFQTYSEVRKPRTQRIIHSSCGTGVILCGRGADVGLDAAKIKEVLPGRWAFIHRQNQGEHKEEALEVLAKLLIAHPLP
ncbi:FAD/NAD(P)-binding domain-containing protein [Amniculicola lignicola CBS 123094]|uniref:FAD/NAD(P)-binding domain-containing protein n=1 Tax=Amniculicola lignicola CBS 123094 TaxID=1392246 RepID=A0A6A5WD22_9PLEO|nr:FAD/NAD(P)-binding domain-containing protein [Amniculicola lignicola CBS 123094]